MNKRKLFILEKDRSARKRLAGLLSGLPVDIKEIPSFSEASSFLSDQNSFSVVLLSLPSISEQHKKTLHKMKKANLRSSMVLLSKTKNLDLALSLLEKRIVDQIAPPDNPASILSSIKNEFIKKDLEEKNESYRRYLQKLESERSKNKKKASDLEEIYESTLENLMTALDIRDVETFGHSKTVAKYSLVLARILGIKGKDKLANIKKGALLHDVGKIAIPDSILKKPSSLSAQEWSKIKLHPSVGFGLIKEHNRIKEIGNIILYHHERYDGNGYPSRLKKKDIPVEARIFALADALDAITSHRPYRKERSFEAARKEIKENSGTQFDPFVVEAFCSLSLENWKKIRFETTQFMPSIEHIREMNKM
ncbi:MAG: HD-GYP domain-containing protein, partial [Candidatus Aminicenantes bacterium]